MSDYEMSRWKRFVFGMLLLCLSVAIMLAAGEVLVRLLAPQEQTAKWLIPHEKYGMFQKKNYACKHVNTNSRSTVDVQTNSLGLRDKEYDLSDKTAKRVLLIGDSFTFGWGLDVKHTFGSKLEVLLNEALGNYYVINAGVPDWGTLQETIYARDHFRLFKPDIIVLTFCGNDMRNDEKYRELLQKGFQGYFYFPGKNFMRKYSHLYRFVRREIWKFQENMSALKCSDKSTNTKEKGSVDEQTSYTLTEKEWQQTLKYIRNFHSEFLMFNSKGVLLLQATAPWNQDIRKHLSRLTNGVNLFYVDLYEDTENLMREERRLPHDGHWPEKIHTMSAQALFDEISEISMHKLEPGNIRDKISLSDVNNLRKDDWKNEVR